jgi:hypothetical protein
MVNKENKYIPGVYKNPSNYETIKVYIVVPGDPYDASILGVFRDKRKAEIKNDNSREESKESIQGKLNQTGNRQGFGRNHGEDIH